MLAPVKAAVTTAIAAPAKAPTAAPTNIAPMLANIQAAALTATPRIASEPVVSPATVVADVEQALNPVMAYTPEQKQTIVTRAANQLNTLVTTPHIAAAPITAAVKALTAPLAQTASMSDADIRDTIAAASAMVSASIPVATPLMVSPQEATPTKQVAGNVAIHEVDVAKAAMVSPDKVIESVQRSVAAAHDTVVKPSETTKVALMTQAREQLSEAIQDLITHDSSLKADLSTIIPMGNKTLNLEEMSVVVKKVTGSIAKSNLSSTMKDSTTTALSKLQSVIETIEMTTPPSAAQSSQVTSVLARSVSSTAAKTMPAEQVAAKNTPVVAELLKLDPAVVMKYLATNPRVVAAHKEFVMQYMQAVVPKEVTPLVMAQAVKVVQNLSKAMNASNPNAAASELLDEIMTPVPSTSENAPKVEDAPLLIIKNMSLLVEALAQQVVSVEQVKSRLPAVLAQIEALDTKAKQSLVVQLDNMIKNASPEGAAVLAPIKVAAADALESETQPHWLIEDDFLPAIFSASTSLAPQTFPIVTPTTSNASTKPEAGNIVLTEAINEKTSEIARVSIKKAEESLSRSLSPFETSSKIQSLMNETAQHLLTAVRVFGGSAVANGVLAKLKASNNNVTLQDIKDLTVAMENISDPIVKNNSHISQALKSLNSLIFVLGNTTKTTNTLAQLFQGVSGESAGPILQKMIDDKITPKDIVDLMTTHEGSDFIELVMNKPECKAALIAYIQSAQIPEAQRVVLAEQVLKAIQNNDKIATQQKQMFVEELCTLSDLPSITKDPPNPVVMAVIMSAISTKEKLGSVKASRQLKVLAQSNASVVPAVKEALITTPRLETNLKAAFPELYQQIIRETMNDQESASNKTRVIIWMTPVQIKTLNPRQRQQAFQILSSHLDRILSSKENQGIFQVIACIQLLKTPHSPTSKVLDIALEMPSRTLTDIEIDQLDLDWNAKVQLKSFSAVLRLRDQFVSKPLTSDMIDQFRALTIEDQIGLLKYLSQFSENKFQDLARKLSISILTDPSSKMTLMLAPVLAQVVSELYRTIQNRTELVNALGKLANAKAKPEVAIVVVGLLSGGKR